MIKRVLTLSLAFSMLFTATLTAQDFDGFDDFGGFDDTSSSEPVLTFNGSAEVNTRAYLNTEDGYQSSDDISATSINSNAQFKLDAVYNGANSDIEAKLNFDTAKLKDYPEDILEEVIMRGYFGNLTLEGGKMKVVWGKGDKLHVLDNFNANDYTDFVFPNYVDRRIAEPMLRAIYATPNNLRIEGVYTPMMTADRFASSGELVPYSMSHLTDTVMGIANHNLSLAMTAGGSTAAGAIMDLSSFSTEDLYEENIKTLKYGQGGLRVTGTLGSFDWGASYYYGHYKQPSANLSPYISSLTEAVTKFASTPAGITYIQTTYGTEIAKVMAATGLDQQTATKAVLAKHATDLLNAGKLSSYELELPSLNYDQVQTFGLEAAFVLWKFNTRWELAYNLTEDTAGDNPWIKNNSIAWLGGFDMDLPIHNVNINIQETGTFTLNSSKIKDGDFKVYDVDYNTDDNYCINKLVVNISDTFMHEKLKPEVTVIWGIENKELCVQPKVEYNAVDGLYLNLKGGIIYSNNENGEFYNFTADSPDNHVKSFVGAGLKYTF